MNESALGNERKEEERRFSQEQYDMLKRCSEKNDVSSPEKGIKNIENCWKILTKEFDINKQHPTKIITLFFDCNHSRPSTL